MTFFTQYGMQLNVKDFQLIHVQSPIGRKRNSVETITMFAIKIIKDANGMETEERVPIRSFDNYLRAELYAQTIRSLMEKDCCS